MSDIQPKLHTKQRHLITVATRWHLLVNGPGVCCSLFISAQDSVFSTTV